MSGERCPHCTVVFKAQRQNLYFTALPAEIYRSDRDCRLGFFWVVCPGCERLIVYLHHTPWVGDGDSYVLVESAAVESFIYPKASTRPLLHHSVPSVYADDYKEACLVLADSPKASAALSRRCLQNVIRGHLKIEHKNLYDEIQEVIEKKLLPSDILDDIDAVRKIGNFAAHLMKSESTGEIFDVEPGEAEWSLVILESIFDFCFARPFASKERRDAVNKKLAAAGMKPIK